MWRLLRLFERWRSCNVFFVNFYMLLSLILFNIVENKIYQFNKIKHLTKKLDNDCQSLTKLNNI